MAKLIVIGIILLVILFFAHMRFACTGIYTKRSVTYTNPSGQYSSGTECVYVGWKHFKFDLFKKWFDNN